jgi:pimeloyl-ACP methyl ester carboxylesterase
MLMAAALAGAALLVKGARRARRILGAAVGGLLVMLMGLRIIRASGGRASMTTLPSGTSSRWAGRIIDEQDMSLAGARLLRSFWRLPRDEREQLVPAMRDAYVEMRRDLGTTPSPVLDTLLSRQGPGAFDTVVIEPRGVSRPRVGLVFLHGYAGSFTLECWLAARAASAIAAVTVCPATEFSGHWSGRDGERTLDETLHYLQARAIERVYLVGLSNGAVGASMLAPRFASSLRGLILISGAPSAGGGGGLPTLVVQGDHDPIASAATARAFAERTHATVSSFDGGHFVLMMRRDEIRNAIASWLRRHEESQ